MFVTKKTADSAAAGSGIMGMIFGAVAAAIPAIITLEKTKSRLYRAEANAENLRVELLGAKSLARYDVREMSSRVLRGHLAERVFEEAAEARRDAEIGAIVARLRNAQAAPKENGEAGIEARV